MTQKKKWSAKAKLEIALLALKGDRTIHDICQHYQVAPSQVHAWKKLMIDEGAQLFERSSRPGKGNSSAVNERVQSQLYEKIGQLTVERDFLKKVWGRLPGHGDEV